MTAACMPDPEDEDDGWETGDLRFDIGDALPAPLVEKLIAVRLRQAFPD